MARNAGYSVENAFTNGLVTEATGLNFPENAVTETDNCVFDEDGSVRRRNGIDREEGFITRTHAGIQQAVSEYVWDSVGGNGNLTFLVQQTGSSLSFFNSASSGTLSDNYVGGVSLTAYATDTSEHPLNIFQYSAGLGKLIVTNPYGVPVYITYNPDNNSFSVFGITILTRDFKGLQPHPIGRQSSISPEHLYNLRNQGWGMPQVDRMIGMSGVYPSDYDVWWLYKTPDSFGTEVFLTDLAYQAGILNQIDRGNSPAPKGSFILNELYQDRSSVSQIGGIPIVSSGPARPATNAFHAGRVFYGGINAEEFNSKIYFSQIIEGPEQFAKCYQENDPTSQYTPDLLPTDGGVISIPEAGTIYKLWSVDTSLLVFASTGVWQITGSSGIGFTATDYTVKKIASVQSISANSFVNVNGSPLWWGLDAIYGAVADQTGSIQISPISDAKIKSFYSDVPEQSKVYAKGAYNTKTKVVQWLYRDQSAQTISAQYSYNRILNLNTVTQAFYPWTLPQSGGTIKGIVSIKGLGSELITENVYDNLSELVVADTGEAVFTQTSQPSQISSHFKYLVNWSPNNFTYGDEIEDSSGDWASFFGGSPLNAEAFFVTGYKTRGQGIKKAQSNYLRLYNRGIGSIRLNSRWDTANSGSSGRWSPSQVISFPELNYEYTTKRVKVRGHGLIFQYVVKSYGGNPFDLIGWASFDTSNERP